MHCLEAPRVRLHGAKRGRYRVTAQRVYFLQDKKTVCVYKTGTTAHREWNKQVNAALDQNHKIRLEHQADLKAARRGDPEACARLIDY